MNKTKIEWTDYTFNPIKGLCPVNCKTPDGVEYCYARKMYKRFGKYFHPSFWPHLVSEPKGIKKPSKIFVCSTFELFHKNIESWYRDEIFETIEACPQHTFQILTKMPENIDRPIPDNTWLGCSITGRGDLWKWPYLIEQKAKTKFISIEPFFNILSPCFIEDLRHADWIIVGRLTGHGKKYNPPKFWVSELVNFAKDKHIPIFLKDNLKDIWGEDLIQEFPDSQDCPHRERR